MWTSVSRWSRVGMGAPVRTLTAHTCVSVRRAGQTPTVPQVGHTTGVCLSVYKDNGPWSVYWYSIKWCTVHTCRFTLESHRDHFNYKISIFYFIFFITGKIFLKKVIDAFNKNPKYSFLQNLNFWNEGNEKWCIEYLLNGYTNFMLSY